MAHIRKRGKAWQVIVQAAGEKRHFTVRGSHEDARRFAREQERDLSRIARRKRVGLRGVVLFSELLRHYEENVLPVKRPSTQASYQTTLNAARLYFVDGLDDPPLEDLEPEHLQAYLDWRRVHGPDGEKVTRPLSERTREKERAVLRVLFQIAMTLGWHESDPVARVPKPKPAAREPVLLKPEQRERLLSACAASRNPMLRFYVRLLLETGLRSRSEALWLRWDDVDLEAGRIRVESSYHHATKSGRTRFVSMPPPLREAMREHFARYRFATYHGERSPWVFHHSFDNRGTKAGERVESMYRGFKRATKRAKLPAELRVHDLRHLWVTRSLAVGVPTAHVKEAAGHADYATTDRYAHLVADEYLASFEARYLGNDLATSQRGYTR